MLLQVQNVLFLIHPMLMLCPLPCNQEGTDIRTVVRIAYALKEIMQ